MITGHTSYGVLVTVPEHSETAAWAVHAECVETMRGAIGMRVVEVGPGTEDPAQACGLTSCGQRLGTNRA